jgi:drug/metabolite transporter (DMT)-like permease
LSPPEPAQRALGRWLVFTATLCWGTTATLARSVFRDGGVPAQTVVELRLVVLGLFGVAAVQGTYYYSIAKLGVGLAILLQYVAPSLIVLWEMARGRRPSPAMVAAVLLALAGTALLVSGVDRSRIHASAFDWFVGASSSVIFAFYVLASKRLVARYAPETVLVYTFAIAAVFWACVTPPWRIVAAKYPASMWVQFAVLGVFSTLVPFRCFYAGLKRLPAAEAGVIASAEPVVAILAAFLFLGEGLKPAQMLGAAMVIVAAVLASRGHPETAEAGVERG